jgi:hypothetical protein
MKLKRENEDEHEGSATRAWSDAKTLVAMLSTASTVFVGDDLNLMANTLKAACVTINDDDSVQQIVRVTMTTTRLSAYSPATTISIGAPP